MKILHVIKDEKFPDSAYEFFESVAPGQNTYLLAGTAKKIKYLNKISPIRVSEYAFLSSKFIRFASSYDAIIMHSLYSFSIEMLARVDSRVPIVWIGMGYDYYDLVTEQFESLLKNETLKYYIANHKAEKIHFFTYFRGVFKRLIYPNSFKKKQLIKKVSFFAPVLESEYSLVKKEVGEPFPSYIQWNYGKIADLIDGKLENNRVHGKNILVGNSATFTNNHIDIFLKLYEIGINDESRIVVPLSYGDPHYREKVILEGRRLFGNKFLPITDFLSLDSYIELLSTCSCVLMGHLRQQALGNLIISLYLGSNVFLDASNPVYENLKATGFEIGDLDFINYENVNATLDVKVTQKHRELLKRTRSRKVFLSNTENLVNKLRQLTLERKAGL